ncbi:MAG: threonine synthase [Candidatus Methanomethylicus sp.]|nr:threonine synthase [Candidatus Methanomethylicus sp.]
MSCAKSMRCSKCGGVHDLSEGLLMCPKGDKGRLDIIYDYDSARETLGRGAVENRKSGLWKCFELLPTAESNCPKLGIGGTPIIKAERLSPFIGIDNLILKDETRGPTSSFKDRSMAVGIAKAIELGYRTTVTASSGNAAAALSAQSAAAGLNCVAFVVEIAASEKLAQLLSYGAKVVRVRGLGSEDPTVKMMLSSYNEFGWYLCPSFGPFNPYQVEGPKTISFEICEQLGWALPDWILVPSGAGCFMAGLWKGFKDFHELGLIDSIPHLVVVQSSGNAPIVRAFQQGKRGHNIDPWEKPDTIATGLEDPYPWDGDAALEAVDETGGTCIAVNDDSIILAQRLLASKQGIFGEPSGVAGLAGLMALMNDGLIDRKDRVLLPITGSGLKDLGPIKQEVESVPTIDAGLEAFKRLGLDQLCAQVPGPIIHQKRDNL